MSSKTPSSNIEWRQWGETDPMFGVSSTKGKEQGGAAPWTADEFFELGRREWQSFLAHWERYGVRRTSCLEIGCGGGRITLHLAKDFATVHALDVSEGMIGFARQHVSAPNVIFHLANGVDLPVPDGSIAAVFSTHVFQHLDSLEYATSYFAEIARVLEPGGTLMIHLPVHRWPTMPTALELLYALQKKLGGVRSWFQRKLISARLAPPIQRVLSYRVEPLFEVLTAHGLADIGMSLFAPEGNASIHPFVLARKVTGRA